MCSLCHSAAVDGSSRVVVVDSNHACRRTMRHIEMEVRVVVVVVAVAAAVAVAVVVVVHSYCYMRFDYHIDTLDAGTGNCRASVEAGIDIDHSGSVGIAAMVHCTDMAVPVLAVEVEAVVDLMLWKMIPSAGVDYKIR